MTTDFNDLYHGYWEMVTIPNKTFLILSTVAVNGVSDVAHTHTLFTYMMFKEMNIFLAKMLVYDFLDARAELLSKD